MKFSILFFFLLFVLQSNAQIGREFIHLKVKGNPVQSLSKQYENVKLDENGMPILKGLKPDSETETIYKDGFPIEIRQLAGADKKHAMEARQVFERDGKVKVFHNYTTIEYQYDAVVKKRPSAPSMDFSSFEGVWQSAEDHIELVFQPLDDKNRRRFGTFQYKPGRDKNNAEIKSETNQ